MALLRILTVPDPLLNLPSRPVRPDEFGEDLVRHASDMAETMYAAPGVGLAAPQVGDLRRLLVADPEFTKEARGKEYLVLVNPVILDASKDKITYEEGCLSVPDFWEEFERPRIVTIHWQDAMGAHHERTFEDYAAVVLQHEIDHLSGVLIVDKVSRFKRSRYLRARRKKLEAAT